jgi:hypothetical protein
MPRSRSTASPCRHTHTNTHTHTHTRARARADTHMDRAASSTWSCWEEGAYTRTGTAGACDKYKGNFVWHCFAAVGNLLGYSLVRLATTASLLASGRCCGAAETSCHRSCPPHPWCCWSIRRLHQEAALQRCGIILCYNTTNSSRHQHIALYLEKLILGYGATAAKLCKWLARCHMCTQCLDVQARLIVQGTAREEEEKTTREQGVFCCCCCCCCRCCCWFVVVAVAVVGGGAGGAAAVEVKQKHLGKVRGLGDRKGYTSYTLLVPMWFCLSCYHHLPLATHNTPAHI